MRSVAMEGAAKPAHNKTPCLSIRSIEGDRKFYSLAFLRGRCYRRNSTAKYTTKRCLYRLSKNGDITSEEQTYR